MPGAIDEVPAGLGIAMDEGPPTMARMVLGYLENHLAANDPDREDLLRLAWQLLEGYE